MFGWDGRGGKQWLRMTNRGEEKDFTVEVVDIIKGIRNNYDVGSLRREQK